MKHKYYFEKNLQTLLFLIPNNCKVVICGQKANKIAKRMSSSKKNIKVDVIDTTFKSKTKYDYIFLNGTLGRSKDIMLLFSKVKKISKPTTRIIIYQHNYLWQGMLTILEKLNVKRKEGLQNWLSIGDVKAYTFASGFEVTRVFKRTLCPINPFGIGKVINKITTIFPFLDFIRLDQYLICRLIPTIKEDMGLTICITVKNEKENIEPIVKFLPILTKKQEILFVEGHSTDGTRNEITRVSKKYKNKNVKVIKQPGKGQGDAIKIGFLKAKYQAIVLYEGDGTSDPNDIKYYYNSIRNGNAEFIEGSRFVYPLNRSKMPYHKQVGNVFFAVWFSFFLGQRTTDVLSGIKAIRKDLYLRIYENWGYLGINDPFGDFELLFGATRYGLKFGEIPMKYYPRIYGKTNTDAFTHGPTLLKMAIVGHMVFRGN